MGDVRHLDIDAGHGLTLHAEISGAGPPLALLHGFTGDTTSWSAIAPRLRPWHQLIAIDLPGHGRSSAPRSPERYALPRLADDLVLLLDAAGASQVAMLGYSMGGRAALQFALRHPSRLRALVLESASPGLADAGERGARRASDAVLAEAIERDGVEAFVAAWEALPLWTSQEALPGALRTALRRQRLRNRADGLAGSLRGAGAGEEPSVLDRLRALDVPTLLVAGARDERYVAHARSMHAMLPGSRLEILQDAGHAVHLERPDALAAAVLEFLRTP